MWKGLPVSEDLLATAQQIENIDAKFISLKENFDKHMPAGKLQMTMIAVIVEFKHSMILKCHREGISIAKSEGKYKVCKVVSVPYISDYYSEEYDQIGYQDLHSGRISITHEN